ncbi:MAG: metal ABC transporter ATP-binding protein [Planctomycetota bacterium]|jgi:ABC-type Mn2+/Zn2+ transport system ATPase subunit|nr:metal ABC transporter ATP-binding protein [Planctomycetota bacterium]
MQPLIDMQGAAFGYGSQPVVSGVDLKLVPGSFLGVLGSNGSGKTTMLRGLLGLLTPLRGRVTRGAVKLGYVPQRETLDPVYPLTVEEVVSMGDYGNLRSLSRFRNSTGVRTHRCLGRVKLLERRKELFTNLSGGQRQRTLIARALMARPNLLVLDEPTSGVDQKAQEQVLELLQTMNSDSDLAIVLVSHQLTMMRSVRDVLWLANGSVQRKTPDEMLQPGTLEQLLGAPESGVNK